MKKHAITQTPTLEQFKQYQLAYSYFNEVLFNGECQPCFLTLVRKAKSHGYFSPNKWQHEGITIHEINLNPDTLARDLIEVFATLVHEMCHLRRYQDKPVCTPYHDTEWANMMISIGLEPISLDNPGRQTGNKVTHKIVSGGKYDTAFKAMPSNISLPWVGYGEPQQTNPEKSTRGGKLKKEKKTQSKVKYYCDDPDCTRRTVFWGKPNQLAICGFCFDTANVKYLIEEGNPDC